MGGMRAARRPAGAVVIALVVVGLSWLVLGGGGGVGSRLDQAEATAHPRPAPAAGQPPRPKPVRSARALVDRVMLVGFDGSGDDAGIVDELANHDYGGVLIRAANWDGAKPGAKLTAAIRSSGSEGEGPPPLIATVQEGGDFRSLADLAPADREADIGAAGDLQAAERWAKQSGDALASAGIDLNLAPVADIATPDTPIADRSFSDDAGVATVMTAAAVRGCERSGIACAVSHFPGLGASSQDTDYGPASVSLDLRTLKTRDLQPFRAAFDAGAPAVVVSHGLYAALDPVTPASLSRAVTTGLLRDDLGFKGLAISDDLAAGAIRAVARPGQSAVEAINAGIDLVQVGDPDDIRRVRLSLLDGLKTGLIKERRLREAASRVDALSRKLDAKR